MLILSISARFVKISVNTIHYFLQDSMTDEQNLTLIIVEISYSYLLRLNGEITCK